MRYLSVCSGIEAATVAWHPLGWQPVAFAEIDAFPCAVLAHHYPDVPNYGDLTKFKEWPDATFDVLVGGTPCQSFSVAGLRQGLADPRGNLALTYLAVLDRYRPTWCVWENVPGVLSADGGGALGAFLGGLAELGYGFAYRVLDAQYFGLAQRRQRVFVVGHLGDWRRAAAVLFERASLSGHPAPRRETGEGSTHSVAPCLDASVCGFARTGDNRGQDPVIAVPTPPISLCLNAGAMGRIDAESETLIPIGGSFDVAHSLRADGFDASEDGTGRGTPIVPLLAPTLDCRSGRSGETAFHTSGGLVPVHLATHNDVAGTMMSYAKSGGGIDNAAAGYMAITAFSAKDHGADAGELAPTLRAGGHTSSHANGGVMPAVAFNWQQGGNTALGMGLEGVPPVRVEQTLAMLQGMQVRRLTPRECERLQGFPDDYTLIPYRGKFAADGPRYKALGNSMAVPVVRWIGERLQLVNDYD